jgi:hypothetical protein
VVVGMDMMSVRTLESGSHAHCVSCPGCDLFDVPQRVGASGLFWWCRRCGAFGVSGFWRAGEGLEIVWEFPLRSK